MRSFLAVKAFAAPDEWVPFVKQEWFYNARHTEVEKRTLARRAMWFRGFSKEDVDVQEKLLFRPRVRSRWMT